jgi:hypothetical protein
MIILIIRFDWNIAKFDWFIRQFNDCRLILNVQQFEWFFSWSRLIEVFVLAKNQYEWIQW